VHDKRKIGHRERKYVPVSHLEIVGEKIFSVPEMPSHIRINWRSDGDEENKKDTEEKENISGREKGWYVFCEILKFHQLASFWVIWS